MTYNEMTLYIAFLRLLRDSQYLLEEFTGGEPFCMTGCPIGDHPVIKCPFECGSEDCETAIFKWYTNNKFSIAKADEESPEFQVGAREKPRYMNSIMERCGLNSSRDRTH